MQQKVDQHNLVAVWNVCWTMPHGSWRFANRCTWTECRWRLRMSRRRFSLIKANLNASKSRSAHHGPDMAEWQHQHVAGHEEVRDIIGSLPLRQEMWPAEGTDLILFRLSMNRTGIKGCFLCGNPADDADDLVPPEVLYRGESDRNYKMPPINKVAACRLTSGA